MLKRSSSFFRSVLRNRLGRNDRPRFLTYTVTFRCNARCIMCDSWKLSSRGDLTLNEIDGIFVQLPRMDAVRLTGGEPFLRIDLVEIAELARCHLDPLLLHITSNGFLTDRIVAFCENRPRTPLHLLISIDGVGEKHNKIRGSNTAWKSVMETIEALAPRQRELRFRLTVNQTIVDAEGIVHYTQLRDLLRPHGVQNNVVLAYDVSATYNVQRGVEVAPSQVGTFSTFGELPREALEELLRKAESDLRELSFPERHAKRYYLRGIHNRLLGNSGQPNPPCVALNAHLRIFPNGDVPTCQLNSRTIGNLRQQSFLDLWKGKRAIEQRSWVRRCPGCWVECEVLPNALYTMDLLRIPSKAKNPVLPEEGREGSKRLPAVETN